MYFVFFPLGDLDSYDQMPKHYDRGKGTLTRMNIVHIGCMSTNKTQYGEHFQRSVVDI